MSFFIVFLIHTQEKFYWKVPGKPFNNLKKPQNPEIYTKCQFEKQQHLSIAILFREKAKYSFRSESKDVEGRAGE